MWKRSEIKAKGKAAFKAEYWACVLAAAVILFISVGSYGGVSISLPSVGNATMALNPLPAHAVNDAADTANLAADTEDVDAEAEDGAEDSDEIPPLNLNDLLEGSETVYNPSTLETILGGIDQNSLLALAGILLAILAVVVALALLIKILILNPLQVAAMQFFKENALEPTSALKFSFNNKYKNIVLGMFVKSIFILLWSLLFIIPGIIKSYSYRMVPFILTDNPDITATDAITLSRKIMKGNKWKAFVLDLSFIGWYLLSALTLGILGMFYVNPYVYATEAELYHAIKTTEAE